ncbi:MAG: acyltransferase family protein [Actinomycetota bacterium]
MKNKEHAYRPDIDGLRALSVVFVVLFHAGVTSFRGGFVGVDVFFVISGFLITGMLVDEVQRSGRVNLPEFYARRARRLLPLAILVVLFTLLAGYALLPPISRGELFADARAAALYFANWRFAAQAGDYFGGDGAKSLLVHYWSLAIEEQFYMIWPLIIVGATKLVPSKHPERRARTFVVALAAVGGASLLGSAILTPREGVVAYYGTHVRIWELAIGAGIALARPWLRTVPRAAAQVAAGVGIIGVGIAALTFSGSMTFPGTAALLPVLGAGLVVGSGVPVRTLVGRGLASGPLPLIGRLSYSWYLWHWPALGIAQLLRTRGGWTIGLGLTKALAILVSFGLAVLTHHIVENPIRYTPRLRGAPRRALAFGLALSLTPVAVAFALPMTGNSTIPKGGPLAMTPEQAKDDNPFLAVGACHQTTGIRISGHCVFGDPNGVKTVALIGDSHALNWFPALDRASKTRGWRLFVWTKSACPVTDVEAYNQRLQRRYSECTPWRKNLLAHLAAIGPLDLIVVGRTSVYQGLTLDENGKRLSASTIGPTWREASIRSFKSLAAVAPRIAVMRDTPHAGEPPPECLSANPTTPGRCSFPRRNHVETDSALVKAERATGVKSLVFLDLTHAICPRAVCPVVTSDGIIMYRDRTHLTATYSLRLAPEVAKLVSPLLTA